MFPEMVDLAPFREVLTNAETRRTFILGLDVGEQWPKWGPHLQAIDELLLSDAVVHQVKELLGEFVRRDPDMSTRLLGRLPEGSEEVSCRCPVAASAIAGELQAMPTEMRAQVGGKLSVVGN